MTRETKQKLISWFGAWVIRLLGLTMRIRIHDEAGFLEGKLPCPTLFAFWHNRMVGSTIVGWKYYHLRKGKGRVVLTSPSRDGGWLSELMARFGIGSVRGSSSRRGAVAIRELDDRLAEGLDVIITPDGPRGPCYKLGPGLIFLAQKNALPLVPVHVEYSRCIRLKSWDRFMIPLPFSRVDLTFSAVQHIAPTTTNEAFETERLRIEKILQPENL